jgi:hypothetical protein
MNSATTTLAQNASAQSPKKPRRPLSRTGIFWYDLFILALLVAVGACYIQLPGDYFKSLSPAILLAIESAWFGSLGGVIISLKGIYDHSEGPDGWDPAYNLWHFGRPISGAIAGLMTVVLLQTVSPGKDLARPVVFAAAFIFGTQERRFFNLLYEVARLIVQVPEEAKSGFALSDIQPPQGSAGSVVVVTGQGIESTAVVKLGAAAVENLVVSSDGTSAAGLVPSRPPGADLVDVTVINSAGKSASLPGRFKFTG